MTHQIDSSALFELTIEEKVFRAAKRVCITFAVAALTLSALDIVGVRSAENAAELWQNNREKIAALPDTITSEIHRMIRGASDVAVAVRIPIGFSSSESNSRSPRPIDELADLRDQDAVELAMEQPPAMRVKFESLDAMAQEYPMPKAAVPIAAPEKPVQVATAESGPISAPETTLASAPVSDALPSLPAVGLIPIGEVPLPRSAPGAPPPSPAQLLHLDDKAYAKAERCLSRAIYFESRSEPVRGQEAVAQVVINRVFSGFYPKDVCAVIYQNANRHLACQFTFACDGKRKVINERGAWARANRIARQTLDGKLYVPAVAKSTHYHAAYVHPYWTREMHKLARFGIHTFYRPIAWGNGSYEPVWGKEAMAQNKTKK